MPKITAKKQSMVEFGGSAMAMNHLSRLWMDAEPALVEAVARKLCERHGAEIFGYEAVTAQFLDERWRCFECEARDVISVVRDWDFPRTALVEDERPTEVVGRVSGQGQAADRYGQLPRNGGRA